MDRLNWVKNGSSGLCQDRPDCTKRSSGLYSEEERARIRPVRQSKSDPKMEFLFFTFEAG